MKKTIDVIFPFRFICLLIVMLVEKKTKFHLKHSIFFTINECILHRFRPQDLCQVFILKNIHNPFASS